MERLITGAQLLGLALDSSQVGKFIIYFQELVDWNQRMNLTAITDYQEVQVKHFLDALSVTLVLPEPTAAGIRLIDVGTGAGIPGIPLKIVYPNIELVLLDSIAKKAVFLRHLVGRLALSNVEIVVGRAEEVARRAEYREKFHIVLSRAVASLPVLVELALPFCAINGRFIAQKKDDVKAEVGRAARAISLMGGQLRGIRTVGLAGLEDHCLIVIDKTSPTPPTYPRRPGIPAKRPVI